MYTIRTVWRGFRRFLTLFGPFWSDFDQFWSDLRGLREAQKGQLEQLGAMEAELKRLRSETEAELKRVRAEVEAVGRRRQVGSDLFPKLEWVPTLPPLSPLPMPQPWIQPGPGIGPVWHGMGTAEGARHET